MKFDVDEAKPRYEMLGLCFILVVVNLIFWVGAL